jgi:hypothetical protein
MPSTAIAGRGSKLQRSPDGSTYTTIAEVKKTTASGSKSDFDDITNFDSPSNFREYLPTLLDGGEYSFDCLWYPGSSIQTQLRTDWTNQSLLYWKFLLSNGTNGVSFQGYVSNTDFDAPVDKSVTKNFKIKVTGPVTEF